MGGLRILLPSDNGIEIPTSSGSDAGIKHQTQGWARTAQVARLPSAGGEADFVGK
ncbi:hypothetical protein [Mesotoga sp.]|uniref:hypothetical protein n=1 Tax=Mesotoga sp. TaxID=2053577 RepID=UPI00345ED590